MLRPREDTEKNGLCLHVLVQKETIPVQPVRKPVHPWFLRSDEEK